MQKASASDRAIRRARVSWEQAQEDLRIAKSRIRDSPEVSCLQATQAAINAFSSVLEAQGHFQLPAFSSVEMLDACVTVAPDLESIRSQCYVLDSMLERDVLGKARQKNVRFTPAFAKTCHRAAEGILNEIRKFWSQ
ncbi:MAG: hypothetical protein VX610_01325 [SAR324 cluster bacterium]|nr:hypothetical protein [SAR324 cluster bacterium]